MKTWVTRYFGALKSRATSMDLETPTTSLEQLKPSRMRLKLYYMVAMALARGSDMNHRSSLPEELVIYICRLAGFSHVNSAYAHESKVGDISVHSSGPLATRIWFRTQPLSRRMLNHIKSVRLVTDSRHQGWISDPSVSMILQVYCSTYKLTIYLFTRRGVGAGLISVSLA